jgi:hypothetical protein
MTVEVSGPREGEAALAGLGCTSVAVAPESIKAARQYDGSNVVHRWRTAFGASLTVQLIRVAHERTFLANVECEAQVRCNIWPRTRPYAQRMLARVLSRFTGR